MSPGAKLTVIMAGATAVTLTLRWLLQKIVGPSRPSAEFKVTGEFDHEQRYDADDSNAPHSLD